MDHRDTARWSHQQRKARDLTQVQVAKKLRRYQSYITLLETGQRRLDVVEFMGDAIGFDARPVLAREVPTWRAKRALSPHILQVH